MDQLKLHIKALRTWRAFRESKWALAGAIIFNPEGQLLLMRSRQRGAWEYPAGAIDGAESPLEGCRREVAEEVNLHPTDFRFLGIDFFIRPGAPNGALFFTFGATVTAEEAAGVRLQAFEATDFRWVTRAEAHEMIEPRLATRLRHLLAAYDAAQPVLLRDGNPR